MVGLVDLPSQRLHDYAMMQHNDAPVRYISHIPYSVARDGGGASPGPIEPGLTHLGDKADRYTTTAGVLTLAEYNARAVAFRPAQMADEHRFTCDTTVKWNADDPRVDALYRLEQEPARTLAGTGAGLSRADVEARR